MPSKRLGLLIIFFLTIALYGTQLPQEFTNWDDPQYILENHWIRSLKPSNLYHLCTEPFVANYLPVTMLSYALDYQLWGLNSRGYHIDNLLIHVACILAVYFLLTSFALSDGVLLFVVALFALHPTNVESIFWASERKNLLSALFFIIALILYIRYHTQHSRTPYFGSILFYLLSLLSKASAIGALFIFLGYDYFLGNRKMKELKLYDKIPFLILAEIVGFWTFYAAQSSKSLISYHPQGIGMSIWAIPRVLAEYVGLLVCPLNLNVLYLDHTRISWVSLSIWLGWLFIFATCVWAWKKDRTIFFWMMFIFFLMLPILNLVPLPVKMANRYLYVPQIGFWVILATCGDRVLDRWKEVRWLKTAATLLLILWGLFLINQTYTYARTWKNSYSLWTDSLNKEFKNPTAQINLGDYLLKQMHQPNRAAVHSWMALQFFPHSRLASYNLGVFFMQNGKWELAKKYLALAINSDPDRGDDALNAMGAVYYGERDWAHALLMFHRAIWINPKNQEAWDNIFHVYAKQGEWMEARGTAIQMIRRFPESPVGPARLAECQK